MGMLQRPSKSQFIEEIVVSSTPMDNDKSGMQNVL
jgi:hypothetical protein